MYFWRLHPSRHQSFWQPWLCRPLRVLPYLHGYVYLHRNGRVPSPERLDLGFPSHFNTRDNIQVLHSSYTPCLRLQSVLIQKHPSARHQVNFQRAGQRKRIREPGPGSNSEVGAVRCTHYVRLTPRVNNDGLEVAATNSSAFPQWSRVVLFRGQTVNDRPRFLKGCQHSRETCIQLFSVQCLSCQ